jgi:hypothetical protein
MKNPKQVHLSERCVGFIAERGGVMSIFSGATVVG